MPRATIIDPMADTRFEAGFADTRGPADAAAPLVAVPPSKDDASFVIQPTTLGLDASFDEEDETMLTVPRTEGDDLDALFGPSPAPAIPTGELYVVDDTIFEQVDAVKAAEARAELESLTKSSAYYKYAAYGLYVGPTELNKPTGATEALLGNFADSTKGLPVVEAIANLAPELYLLRWMGLFAWAASFTSAARLAVTRALFASKMHEMATGIFHSGLVLLAHESCLDASMIFMPGIFAMSSSVATMQSAKPSMALGFFSLKDTLEKMKVTSIFSYLVRPTAEKVLVQLGHMIDSKKNVVRVIGFHEDIFSMEPSETLFWDLAHAACDCFVQSVGLSGWAASQFRRRYNELMKQLVVKYVAPVEPVAEPAPAVFAPEAAPVAAPPAEPLPMPPAEPVPPAAPVPMPVPMHAPVPIAPLPPAPIAAPPMPAPLTAVQIAQQRLDDVDARMAAVTTNYDEYYELLNERTVALQQLTAAMASAPARARTVAHSVPSGRKIMSTRKYTFFTASRQELGFTLRSARSRIAKDPAEAKRMYLQLVTNQICRKRFGNAKSGRHGGGRNGDTYEQDKINGFKREIAEAAPFGISDVELVNHAVKIGGPSMVPSAYIGLAHASVIATYEAAAASGVSESGAGSGADDFDEEADGADDGADEYVPTSIGQALAAAEAVAAGAPAQDFGYTDYDI